MTARFWGKAKRREEGCQGQGIYTLRLKAQTHKRTRTDFKLIEDMRIDLNEYISELQHSGINGSEDTTKRQISLLKLL